MAIKCMKSVVSLFILILITKETFCQNSSFKYEFQTPPSPNAASLGLYGEIPVNHYTGLPNINIPLLKASTRSLGIDVSLSYHMGGIRVDEEASWVGLGWSLNGQGVITRVVKDRADEVSMSCADKDPDVFYFNFLGKSGKFIFHPDTKEIILIDKEAISITKLNPNNLSDGFLIKLNNGVKLYFDVKEYQETTEGSSVNNYTTTTTLVSSWFVSKIESTVGEAITFEYTSEFPTQRKYRSFTRFRTTSANASTLEWVSGSVTSANCYTLQELGLDQQDPNVHFIIENHSTIKYRNKYLKKIKFETGSIEFVTSNREDLLGANPGEYGQKLDQVILRNNSGRIINKIYFIYSYLNSQSNNGALSKRLLLTEFNESRIGPGTNTKLYSYNFFYNNTQLPDKNSWDQDYWGFYNGPKNNPIDPSLRNNEPDASYCKAGVLEKIVYPAGGYTIFEAGINDYAEKNNPNLSKQGGGLRINKITNYTDDGKIANVKKYEYKTTGQNGQTIYFGKLIGVARKKYDYINSYQASPFNYQRTLHKKNNFCTPQYKNGLPVYEKATIRYTSHNDATSSSNTLPLGEHSNNGNPVCYDKVIEYSDENGIIGKIEHEFKNNYATPDLTNNYYYPANMPQVVPITNGQLLRTTVYKHNGGTYDRIYEKSYSYLSKEYQEIACKRKSNLGNAAPYCGFQLDYKIYVDWSILNSEIQNNYFDNNQVITEQVYYNYDNPFHKQITSSQRIKSTGAIENETYKYPSDFSASNSVYQTMVGKYIIAPVIEHQKTIEQNGVIKPVIKTKIEYDNFFNFQLPKSEFIQIENNPIEERIRYDYNDKGKLVEQHKLDDLKSAFIWDYQSAHPIAEVINASYYEIAYTSFEADGAGSWYFTPLGVLKDMSAPTGNKCYDISAGQLNAFGLSPSKGYKLSYWYKTGSSINVSWGTHTNIFSGPTLNGWTYTERIVTGTNLLTLEGTGYIDELRLHPADAFMKTYTYETLVGMTSQCDANKSISYYEYDVFGRLVLVRDRDKNVLKKNCYVLKSQTESCTVYYSSYQQSIFTKECPSGYTGSQVTYSVPAGLYISTISQLDADNHAIADLYENGQVYANAIGTCTQVTGCSLSNCYGEGFKCVNDFCEQGIKVYTDSYYDPGMGMWVCIYHYEWSDGSWSGDYYQYSPSGGGCAIE